MNGRPIAIATFTTVVPYLNRYAGSGEYASYATQHMPCRHDKGAMGDGHSCYQNDKLYCPQNDADP